MSIHNKVVWAEGMFIRPQHFQQQDRYHEKLITDCLDNIFAYGWGLTALQLDKQLLKLGRIAITECSGVLMDGTPFDIPLQTSAPLALTVSKNIREQLVYLSLPLSRQGMPDVTAQENVVSRYIAKEYTINDNASPQLNSEIIPLAQQNFILLLEKDDRKQFICLPIARISEVTNEGNIILDAEFIPPSLDCKVAQPLLSLLTEIQALLNNRAEVLKNRIGDISRSSQALADFLMLQMINRFAPLLTHLQTKRRLHPEELYKILLQLAGELTTFNPNYRSFAQLIPYHHQELQNTFKPLTFALRQSLSMVIEQAAIALPIEQRDYGVAVAMLHDRNLINSASFILAVKADLPAEDIVKRLPAQIKISTVEHIRELIIAQLPGIKLQAMSAVPPQIPYHTGCSYFQLIFNGDELQQLIISGGLALHISGEFPGLKLELWAIREKV